MDLQKRPRSLLQERRLRTQPATLMEVEAMQIERATPNNRLLTDACAAPLRVSYGATTPER